jgi:ABC-type multidrug transport system ATPase subunit
VITLERVAARRAPLALANVSLEWGAGIHTLVGASADGGPLLLGLVAGATPPRSGRVRVLDGSPADATVRKQVAYVPLERALPGALDVQEVLAIAAAIRGEPARNAAERLSTLGVESLASRGVRTLSREEARAVAIVEAVTSSRVRVLLIEEPFVALDPRAATRLPGELRARAREGWAIVIATASVRDAVELSDDHVVLRGGTVTAHTSSLQALAGFSPHGVTLRILASDPRALAAALAREAGVEAVVCENAGVVARGRDTLELARAAARAIMLCGVDVTELRVEAPSLEEVRAAVTGVATATYESALARTRASLAALMAPPQDPGDGTRGTSQEPPP